MAMGDLKGYAISMRQMPFDHTYVYSSYGDIWPCHGRDTGGYIICVGAAEVDKSRCLSQADGEAGIDYSVTGVCHQIANRILLPSSQIVQKARGWRWSLLLYGIYGCEAITRKRYHPTGNPWPELTDCEANHKHP
jgi:hypothetical protein